jgi:hypothetical protein
MDLRSDAVKGPAQHYTRQTIFHSRRLTNTYGYVLISASFRFFTTAAASAVHLRGQPIVECWVNVNGGRFAGHEAARILLWPTCFRKLAVIRCALRGNISAEPSKF